jgi:hypothetical protein
VLLELLDLAHAQDVAAVGELDRAQRVLLDEQDREAVLAQVAQRLEHEVDDERREAERRLVD